MRKWRALCVTQLPAAGYLLLGILLCEALLFNFQIPLASLESNGYEIFYRSMINTWDNMDQYILILSAVYVIVWFVRQRLGKSLEFESVFPVRRGMLFAAAYVCGAAAILLGYAGYAGFSLLSVGQIGGKEILLVSLGRGLMGIFWYTLLFSLAALWRGAMVYIGMGITWMIYIFRGGILNLLDQVLYAYFGFRAEGTGTQIADCFLVLKNVPEWFEESIAALERYGHTPITYPIAHYGVFYPLSVAVVVLVCIGLFVAGFRGAEQSERSKLVPAIPTGKQNFRVCIFFLLMLIGISWHLKSRMQDVIAERKTVGTVPYYVTYSSMGDMPAKPFGFILVFGISAVASIWFSNGVYGEYKKKPVHKKPVHKKPVHKKPAHKKPDTRMSDEA